MLVILSVQNHVGRRIRIILNELPFQNPNSAEAMARRFFWLLLLISTRVFSQQTAIFVDPERQYQNGLDLFIKQKYAAAQKEFFAVQESKLNISEAARGNATYYAAKCAAELFHRDAEFLLLGFIEKYPSNIHVQDARYDLGIYYYRNKNHKRSIEYLEKVDQTSLSPERADEVNFKLGYAYYMTNDYEKASKAFYKMKDGDSKYASAALYYYGHIAYVNENYETALSTFNKLKDSESFGPVVPYYITQIYYKQGRYDELLKYAPSVLDTASTKNSIEIGRMVAESYYRREDYKNAIPYLLDYQRNSPNAGRMDHYVLGYCYYRTKEYSQAIPNFQKVTGIEDSLTQNAYYHLADCYLQTNDKRAARNAFQSAAKMKFDPVINEESQFNFAKLSYELNFQSAAIEAFNSFLKSYPQSVYVDQVNEMLVGLYTNSRNYKDALTSLESVKNKTQSIRIAYQRVAYYRGVELYMDNRSEEAIRLFETSLQYPVDQSLVAQANYWKGEAKYKLSDFDGAIRSYNDFQLTPAAVKLSNYELSNYNLGYSYFKKEDYSNAQTAFRKYIRTKDDADQARYNDALLRIADCFFMLRDQGTAMNYYDQAIANKAKASDYALYQKGVIQGIQGRMSDKIGSLEKLFEKYPKSVYFDDAMYEAGQANMIIGNYSEAMRNFQRIIKDYPSSSYMRKAELGEALVYYNTNEDDKAMAAYKNIVKKYPNTSESKEALMQIKNISVAQNKVDDYVSYVKDVPEADVSDDSQDSLTYEAAELNYTRGNCNEAIADFDRYLERFPNAIFRINANYYKADCLYRSKQYDQSLAGYEFVIAQPKSQFTERSLLNAAAINFSNKNYERALAQYEVLETNAEVKDNITAAMVGQMRAAFQLKDYSKAQTAAQKILGASSDKDLANEAHLISGKCYLQNSELTNAKTELQVVAKRTNSEMTAESKYLLAQIEYQLNNFKESQKLIFEIQKQVPSYDFWIAKGFILLGDNYLAMKDTFQARETYKSIVDNFEKDPADPEDLREIAREKYEALAVKKETGMKMIEEQPEDSLNVVEPK